MKNIICFLFGHGYVFSGIDFEDIGDELYGIYTWKYKCKRCPKEKTVTETALI